MATTNYGLTDSGFSLPGLDALIEETKTSLKAVFGENFNTQSNSLADKFSTIFNEREYQIYLLASMVYSAQTLQGAEGIYLDDLLSKRGIHRRGKTRGSGSVEMTVNNTVPYNMVYSSAAWSIDSGNFVLSRDTQVAGNIVAQKITNQDLVLGNYRMTIQNLNDQSTQQINLSLTDKTPGSVSLNTFLSNIKKFIVDNTILTNADRIIIDSTEGSIYIGYDTSKRMIGLVSRMDFRTTPLVGDKTVTMDVVAVDAGAISRESGSVTSISPTPSGFVSLTNLREFSDGSDVESDNEYRLRSLSTSSSALAATRPAILSKLLNSVEGVEKVKIFTNNTGETNALGIPAYHFQVVIYGGETEAISVALYEVIALSNMSYGTTFYDITTEDDQIERIWHTKATSRPVAIRVRYRGKVLSLGEQTDINNSLINIVTAENIAGTLYNIQLVSAVGSAISAGRFTSLVVEVKDVGQPDSAYTTLDFVAGYDRVLTLNADNITYNQII